MSAEIKGWCPSAHRPMMSGDGLLARVRPRMGRLSAAQTHTLCDLAGVFGNGMIDVTSRANLQIRGVPEAQYPALLSALIEADLVDADPDREAKRTLTFTPFWRRGDLTDRLGKILEASLTDLPVLPDKMGVLLDTGARPVLGDISGDFRFEISDGGTLILRADGAQLGREVDEPSALSALIETANWFVETGGVQSGRMGRHLKNASLPDDWQTRAPASSLNRPEPGGVSGGHIFGVPFGQVDALGLKSLITASEATHMRVTPWRMLFLEEAKDVDARGFLNKPDALISVAACPGAPACAQATVGTRAFARRVASQINGTLHVSGCAKGCAHRLPSDITLVGRDGKFDLVKGGVPGDTPVKKGLSEADILQLVADAHAV